jgi:aminoglycoside phosphotransferase (APT) family kinase protein
MPITVRTPTIRGFAGQALIPTVGRVSDNPTTIAAVDRALGQEGLEPGTVALRQLPGGTHASTWLVWIERLGIEAVLREFPAGDASVVGEAQVLRGLDGLGGLAPRLLAAGADQPIPWLLLSRLPGRADITSIEPEVLAAELGVALARVHGARGDRLSSLREVYEMRGGKLQALSGPAASSVRSNWQRIISEPLVLTHNDYWSGNVVWDGPRLSGVVDWNGGALGPRGYDVGWCRLDLYLLYGETIAALFSGAYERAFGQILTEPALWDLWAVARSGHVETWVPNYHGLGRVDLTAEVLRKRHTAWTARALDSARY